MISYHLISYPYCISLSLYGPRFVCIYSSHFSNGTKIEKSVLYNVVTVIPGRCRQMQTDAYWRERRHRMIPSKSSLGNQIVCWHSTARWGSYNTVQCVTQMCGSWFLRKATFDILGFPVQTEVSSMDSLISPLIVPRFYNYAEVNLVTSPPSRACVVWVSFQFGGNSCPTNLSLIEYNVGKTCEETFYLSFAMIIVICEKMTQVISCCW